jgi:hypothetical protein
LAAFLLVQSAPGRLAAAEAAPQPLDRRLRLDIWGGGLAGAIREIREKTGVAAVVYPPDLPEEETSGNLYLVSGQVSLGTILESLARRYSFRYRVAGPDRVEISRGYDWVRDGPALRFIDLDLPPRPEELHPAAMRELLGEFIKPLPLLSGDYSLTIEKNPVMANPGALRAVAALPPALADYLVRAVACLAGSAGDHPFAAPGRTALARQYGGDWRALLDRQVAVPGDSSPRSFLAGIASQAGIPIIVSANPAGASLAGFTAGRLSLGRLGAELAPRLKARKRVFLAAGALLFEAAAGGGEEMELDDRGRELFWTGLAVAGFDAGLAATDDDPGLAARIRREVFPSLWRDPVTAIVHSRANGRLVVIAPANVLPAVAEKLAELSR